MPAIFDIAARRQFATTRILKPSAPLAEFVRHYDFWEAPAGTVAKRPFAVSLFPLITFYLRQPAEAIEYGRAQRRVLPRVVAVGPCDHRVAEVRDVGLCRNLTVIFQPAGFYRLLHVSPGEIRNYAHDGTDVLGARVSGLCDRLCEMSDPEAMVAALEAALMPRVSAALDGSRMQWAAEALLCARGSTDLALMAEELGLSDSSWRRQFSCQIGFGPKRYLRMARFQHAVSLKHADPGLSWTRLCLEAGYYDQSHCIAEFREMAGAAPSRYLQEIVAVPQEWVSAINYR